MAWSFNYIAITNNIEHALVLNDCGVQQIMVDTENIGKAERQFGKNAVINFHKLEDVHKLKSLGLNSKIISRLNGFNSNIGEEIEKAIDYGSDLIMLPMIQNINCFNEMLTQINNRVPVVPLIETPYSIFKLKEIIEISVPEQLHFGLNDLHLSLGMNNLFEVMLSPLFSSAVSFAKERVKLVGIGGIGDPTSAQKVSPNLLLNEFLLMGSKSVILSRSFFKDGYDAERILYSLNLFENIVSQSPNILNHNLLLNEVENF